MVAWLAVAWLGSSAFAEDEAPQIEMSVFRPYMRQQARDKFLLPYIFDDGSAPSRLVALDGGRVLKHADFARMVGDEARAREIERLAARDKQLTYGSYALTGGSLALTLLGLAADAGVGTYVASAGLALGGLALSLPPAIAGRRVKATRYTADEARAAIEALAAPPPDSDEIAEVP